jgi:hypothetical protein
MAKLKPRRIHSAKTPALAKVSAGRSAVIRVPAATTL